MGHFFDRGNPPVVSKKGNYLVTKPGASDGYIIYRFDPKTERFNMVDNPTGAYSWQAFKTKREAVAYAESLNIKENGRYEVLFDAGIPDVKKFSNRKDVEKALEEFYVKNKDGPHMDVHIYMDDKEVTDDFDDVFQKIGRKYE